MRVADELRGICASLRRAANRSSAGLFKSLATAFSRLALGGVLRNELAALIVLIDGALLGHSSLQGRFGDAKPLQVRNGKLNPRRSARASSSLPAVVQTITSMPQTSSTLS